MAELVMLGFNDNPHFKRQFIYNCVNEAKRLIPLLKAGLHEATPLERLALCVLIESANYWVGGNLNQLPFANASEGEWIEVDGKIVRGEDNDEHEPAL